MSNPNINLRESLRQELIRQSNEMGFKISTKNNLDKTLLDYLTVRFKLIDTKPRKVRFQKDFMANVITEEHPKSKEIKRIVNVARIGGNLNHFKSKKLPQTNFHDHLASEWNIHHFHLSLELDKKSNFVKQGNILLFAYIDDSQIIFLGTDKHIDGIFGDTKWWNVLHKEFPEVISEFKAKGDISEVYPKVNAKERQTLWNKGYTLGMTEIDNTVYLSPGVGRSTSGHSTTVVTTNIDVLRWVYGLEKQLEELYELICKHLKISSDTAQFEIRFYNEIKLVETTNNIILLEYPNRIMTKEELTTLGNV
jgi:hypothetical protein